MKNLKQNIEKLLFDLKRMGFDRATIEDELIYSHGYLTQILSKGGSLKLYKRLLKYKEEKLQNATNKVSQNLKDADIHIKGDEHEIMTQVLEKLMTNDAALKVILHRIAQIESRDNTSAISSEFAKLEKEIADVLQHNFSSNKKLFR